MMTDTQRKASALMGLATNFGKALPSSLSVLWLKMLRPFTAEEVERAVSQVILTYELKTLPPFAVIKKFLPSRPELEPIDTDKEKRTKAEAEWAILLESIATFGVYREPAMMHPTTEYVLLGMGGWRAACGWLAGEIHWRKKEFVEAFILADGHVELLEGGARAIERRQAQLAALGTDDRALMKIPKNAVQDLRRRMLEPRAGWNRVEALEGRDGKQA